MSTWLCFENVTSCDYPFFTYIPTYYVTVYVSALTSRITFFGLFEVSFWQLSIMPRYCAVFNCPAADDDTSRALHKFPHESHIAGEWTAFVRASGKPNFTLKPYSKICSNHFQSSDYHPLSYKHRKKLLSHAVPSIRVSKDKPCNTLVSDCQDWPYILVFFLFSKLHFQPIFCKGHCL